MYILMVQIHNVNVSIWTVEFCPNGLYLFVYLDASKTCASKWMVQGRPSGRQSKLTVNHR